MNNYTESKKVLDKIRNEYGCKGEVLFRTALQYVIEAGQENLKDEEWVNGVIKTVNQKHNQFESEGKVLLITRDFEIAIIECASELAKIEAYDLLMYIQREVWLSNENMDYQRAIELLKKCMSWIEDDHCECAETLDTFQYIGFTDDEIENFGYQYLFDCVEEEE